MIDRSLNVWSVGDIQLLTSQIPAEHTFLPQQRKLEETPRHCSRSGQSPRARRRAARNQYAENDESLPVHSELATNMNNIDAEKLLSPIEDQSAQVELEIEDQQLLVNDASNSQPKVNAEEELVHCRSLNKELTRRIEAFELEIEKKVHQIRKLELDVSKLKFSSFKPPKKLSIANVQRTDVPPSFS